MSNLTSPMPEASKPLAGRLSEATPPDAIKKTPRISEGCQPSHAAGHCYFALTHNVFRTQDGLFYP